MVPVGGIGALSMSLMLRLCGGLIRGASCAGRGAGMALLVHMALLWSISESMTHSGVICKDAGRG
mgnify:CR=1 FL=1